MQLQVHRHPLLIQPGIQSLLDKIISTLIRLALLSLLTFGRACSRSGESKQASLSSHLLAAFMVNVIGIKYRFVSWIELDHSLFDCMDVTLQDLLLQWLCHFLDILDLSYLIDIEQRIIILRFPAYSINILNARTWHWCTP